MPHHRVAAVVELVLTIPLQLGNWWSRCSSGGPGRQLEIQVQDPNGQWFAPGGGGGATVGSTSAPAVTRAARAMVVVTLVEGVVLMEQLELETAVVEVHPGNARFWWIWL